MEPVWAGNYSQMDPIDIDYVYADSDSHINEIAELYSYTEENEFTHNRNAFEEYMEDFGFPLKWTHMSISQRIRGIQRLAESMDVCSRHIRMKAVRAILYLVQGTFGECLTLEDQARLARENVFALYEAGIFSEFIQLLHMEIENSLNTSALRKPTVSLGDSVDMRLILSVLYTFVETMHVSVESDTDHHKRLREQFREEISENNNDELLAITLFQMITKFCNGSAPHFPIKKVLLLLWKVLLLSLGGGDTLRNLKNLYRQKCNLPPVPDDTIEVARTMRAASPPASATDLIEAQQQRKMNRPFKRQMVIKQNSLIGDETAYTEEGNDVNEDDMLPDERLSSFNNERNGSENNGAEDLAEKGASVEEKMDIGPRPASPRPSTPNPNAPPKTDDELAMSIPCLNKGLPWAPKVRQKDIDSFLDHTRMKFVGYTLPNDRTTTAGLPEPIVEGIKILQNHVYVSLSDVQITREEELTKYPLTFQELDTPALISAAEALYQAMLPSLPQYMIALLKILLAAAPTSKAKNESINIMSDVLPEEMPMTVLMSMKLGVDVNRHKEIITKAVSGILLLLLKHYKTNHVYQFEYISQQLMFANCIPLVLKFFNQNIVTYVTSRNTISVIDFPACVIGEQPELTAETLEISETQTYCWRNMFSCINLLRILNKLTKWKHSRIMMLVVFKSAPILKRALKVRHAMFQLYVLKLLKMQVKYLGRQWRKSNMKTMSAIYQKVRHRLTDDWAYGNDLDARPWDFQAEEFTLQSNINMFHRRRYEKCKCPQQFNNSNNVPNNNEASLGISLELDLLQPVDNNFLSVLSRDIELTNEFKYNYETWLEREVFQFNIDWDQLLTSTDSTVEM